MELPRGCRFPLVVELFCASPGADIAIVVNNKVTFDFTKRNKT